MPPRKTPVAAAAVAAVAETAKKRSSWAEKVAAAKADRAPVAPYMFDGTEPPTPIYPPGTVEQVMAITEMMDSRDDIDVRHFGRLFRTLIGPDAFPPVWEAIKDAPYEALLPLIIEMNDHFYGEADGGDDLPGGE